MTIYRMSSEENGKSMQILQVDRPIIPKTRVAIENVRDIKWVNELKLYKEERKKIQNGSRKKRNFVSMANFRWMIGFFSKLSRIFSRKLLNRDIKKYSVVIIKMKKSNFDRFRDFLNIY